MDLSSSIQALSHDEESPFEEPFSNGTVQPQEQPESQQQDTSNEAAALKGFAATARNQDDLERDIGREAERVLLEQAIDRDNKRLEKTQTQREKLLLQIRRLEQRTSNPSTTTPAASARLNAEIGQLQPQVDALDKDLEQIQRRIEERKADGEQASTENDQTGNTRRPGESRRDFLIRTGKITPFSRIGQGLGQTSANLADVMLDAEGGDSELEEDDLELAGLPKVNVMSHRNLLQPGFADDETASQTDSAEEGIDDRPRKKRRLLPEMVDNVDSHPSRPEEVRDDEDEIKDENFEADAALPSSDAEEDSDFVVAVETTGRQAGNRHNRKSKSSRREKKGEEETDDTVEDLTGIDDGNEQIYLSRLAKWSKGRKAARRKAQAKKVDNDTVGDGASPPIEEQPEQANAEKEQEWLMPHPSRTDAVFEGDFRIPGDIYPSLFDYQKTGVQWLSELYYQQVGGIVGDEMGLGKTIQVISFIAGLHHSNRLDKPIIIVTPATVMKQWVQEFHRWWPPLRVSILHTSGSGMTDNRSEWVREDSLEADTFAGSKARTPGQKAAGRVVDRVLKQGHILVTTYSGLQSYAELLLPIEWGYAVLDEGHKIRNPNAKITIYCKSLRTPNRVILSGTPMQNNLTELWSLFDFIFPLRLGNLVSFRTQFEIPIRQGGYANASNLEVETALKCAETLKDAISPYLLQRFKIDVAADLPKKTEQVLFCRLTKIQREAYESFLASNEMSAILEGRRHSLYGIDILRKICNHPDLVDHRGLSIKPGYNYGSGVKSGKMQVVKALLELWRDTGHKTLLFAQHRIMLDILERFIKMQGGFHYRRMDGTTPIKDRQDLVDEFNNDPEIHVFLLTTKVGGLGVNLTGADRVIIYDPDWNPSTDMQARERSWRLGQKREVMIYRLMTAGTIEEKIYHRQIFKQFLTNKILRDPKQRQTFQLKDLHDLFTLGNAEDDITETGGLFKGTEVKFDKVSATAEGNHDTPIDSEGEDRGPKDSARLNSIVGISHREEFSTGEEKTKAEPKATFPDPSTDISGAPPKAPPVNNDSRILSSIFSRSGVHSALEHDAIISGSSKAKLTADPVIIAAEARKVAAAAARELQRAGEQARNTPIGTPTWTGRMGSGGRPDSYPSPMRSGFGGGRGGRGGGPSSASVLANLSARQQTSLGNDSRGSTPGDENARGSGFMSQIRDYLRAHGGSVYTQMLIDHFNRFCKTPERTAEFKEMLRAIAVLDKGADSTDPSRGGLGGGRFAGTRDKSRGGRAKWVLKKEFGGRA